MAKIKKYYVVWNGRQKGIFQSWDDCKVQIEGFTNAQYKSFESKDEAEIAFKQGPKAIIYNKTINRTKNNEYDYSLPPYDRIRKYRGDIQWQSIAVDAACSGNPGVMEYRGVLTHSGKEIFRQGPFDNGTNNIGEFLALVYGLAILKQKNDQRPIYTDSKIAMGWIKKGKCNTKLALVSNNKIIFDQIERAEKWLKDNQPISNDILKWETELWGEIPADFGRK